ERKARTRGTARALRATEPVGGNRVSPGQIRGYAPRAAGFNARISLRPNAAQERLGETSHPDPTIPSAVFGTAGAANSLARNGMHDLAASAALRVGCIGATGHGRDVGLWEVAWLRPVQNCAVRCAADLFIAVGGQ